MMRHAVLRGDAVANIIIASPGFDPGDGQRVVPLEDGVPVGPGWTYDGETFSPPAEPDPQPMAPDLRPTKSRFGDLFTDDQHGRMNLIRWQCSQMDATDRAVPDNPLVYAETMFRKFDLPAEFIELDNPMVADGLGLLGMLGVFGDDAATEIPRILRNELPS